jgi:hypothetical protein
MPRAQAVRAGNAAVASGPVRPLTGHGLFAFRGMIVNAGSARRLRNDPLTRLGSLRLASLAKVDPQ